MTGPLGIYRKYTVSRASGEPIENQDDYFVLKLTDAHAREALRRYAESVKRYNPILAKELVQLCNEHDGRVHDARFAADAARRNGTNGANGGGR